MKEKFIYLSHKNLLIMNELIKLQEYMNTLDSEIILKMIICPQTFHSTIIASYDKYKIVQNSQLMLKY